MERLDIEYLILGCHYDTTDEQDARASRFGGSTSTAGGIRVTTFAVILLICVPRSPDTPTSTPSGAGFDARGG